MLDTLTDLCAQLVEFILIAATSCNKRAEYVRAIIGMEAGLQNEIKDIITRVSGNLYMIF